MTILPIMWGLGKYTTLILLGVFLVEVVYSQATSSNNASSVSHWQPGIATWYGEPNGDGSTGGACGYGNLVDVKPYKARVGALCPKLFKDGEGCGSCFKVRCLDKDICSKKAVTFIATDECPGCSSVDSHFDLSGAAFGRMAIPGQGGELRNRGLLKVVYRKTLCKYRGKKITFRVNEGSTNYWFSIMTEFEDGDGDIGSMQIRQATSNEWIEMTHLWGANWCINGGPLTGPFSIKLTTLSTGKTLSARDAIPRNWSPRATYPTRLNFLH